MPPAFRSPLSVMITLGVALLCILLFSFVLTNYLNSKARPTDVNHEILETFPISVDPRSKQIIENPLVDWYINNELPIDLSRSDRKRGFLTKIIDQFAQLAIVQQLATPLSRNLVIYDGERKEEVIKHFGDILNWTTAEREEFSQLVTSASPALTEGKFYPGSYVVAKTATPKEVADTLIKKFAEEILSRYDATLENIVPIHDTLIIASLLEREAYDFTDMRYISGVIWNRLFVGMPLQIDATLQYAKGSRATEKNWWPQVRPKDKYIDSPYNTYLHIGLPPTPIANPSLAAVVAALNPQVTDCLFYFHDTDGNFYCSVTYEEHVAKLKEIFGQGK